MEIIGFALIAIGILCVAAGVSSVLWGIIEDNMKSNPVR